MRPMARSLTSLSLLVLLAACGGGQEQVVTPNGAGDGAARPSGPGIGMDADIGALDEGKVRSTFEKQSNKLSSCFERGANRLPYLAGEIRFHIRVDQGGRAKSVHAIDSNLGDLETEECMMRALEGASWPAPEGGREGIAESPFAFEPGGSTRPPVDLDPGVLGADEAKLREVLSSCRDGSHAGRLKATVYVDADGSVKGVGVSGEDAASREAARCVAKGVMALELSSPGSYAGKLTVEG